MTTNTNTQVMQQALDALIYHTEQTRPIERTCEAMDALKAAIAQPVPPATGCACKWNGELSESRCELHEAWHVAILEWSDRAKAAEAKLAQLVQPAWDEIAEPAFNDYFKHHSEKLAATHPSRLVRQLAARLHLAQPVQPAAPYQVTDEQAEAVMTRLGLSDCRTAVKIALQHHEARKASALEKNMPVTPTERMCEVINGGYDNLSAFDKERLMNKAKLLYSALLRVAPTSQPVQPATPLGYINRKDIERLSNYKATIWPGENEIDAVPVYLEPAAQPVPPAKQQNQDAPDAAKYQWVLEGKRSKHIWNHVLTDEERDTGFDIDSVICAALAARGAAK